MTANEDAWWGAIYTTITIRRADVERLRSLAKPRENRKPYERRLEHNYEILTRAISALEREQAEEE